MISSVFCRFVFRMYTFSCGTVLPRRVTRGYGAQFPGCRRVLTKSKALSLIQYICFRKISGSNMGRQTWFLPRAPSNLVTPLVLPLSKISSSCRSDYRYVNSFFLVIVTTYFMKQTSTIHSVDTEPFMPVWSCHFPSNTKYSVLILYARAYHIFCSAAPF